MLCGLPGLAANQLGCNMFQLTNTARHTKKPWWLGSDCTWRFLFCDLTKQFTVWNIAQCFFLEDSVEQKTNSTGEMAEVAVMSSEKKEANWTQQEWGAKDFASKFKHPVKFNGPDLRATRQSIDDLWWLVFLFASYAYHTGWKTWRSNGSHDNGIHIVIRYDSIKSLVSLLGCLCNVALQIVQCLMFISPAHTHHGWHDDGS